MAIESLHVSATHLFGIPRDKWTYSQRREIEQAIRDGGKLPAWVPEARKQIMAKEAMERELLRREWPADARFYYGDKVRVIQKHLTSPSWVGFVVGWYEPMQHARHYGYAVEQEGTGQIHLYVDQALEEDRQHG